MRKHTITVFVQISAKTKSWKSEKCKEFPFFFFFCRDLLQYSDRYKLHGKIE